MTVGALPQQLRCRDDSASSLDGARSGCVAIGLVRPPGAPRNAMRTLLLALIVVIALVLALVAGYHLLGEVDLIRGLFYFALIAFVGGLYWLFRHPR